MEANSEVWEEVKRFLDTPEGRRIVEEQTRRLREQSKLHNAQRPGWLPFFSPSAWAPNRPAKSNTVENRALGGTPSPEVLEKVYLALAASGVWRTSELETVSSNTTPLKATTNVDISNPPTAKSKTTSPAKSPSRREHHPSLAQGVPQLKLDTASVRTLQDSSKAGAQASTGLASTTRDSSDSSSGTSQGTTFSKEERTKESSATSPESKLEFDFGINTGQKGKERATASSPCLGLPTSITSVETHSSILDGDTAFDNDALEVDIAIQYRVPKEELVPWEQINSAPVRRLSSSESTSMFTPGDGRNREVSSSSFIGDSSCEGNAVGCDNKSDHLQKTNDPTTTDHVSHHDGATRVPAYCHRQGNSVHHPSTSVLVAQGEVPVEVISVQPLMTQVGGDAIQSSRQYSVEVSPVRPLESTKPAGEGRTTWPTDLSSAQTRVASLYPVVEPDRLQARSARREENDFRRSDDITKYPEDASSQMQGPTPPTNVDSRGGEPGEQSSTAGDGITTSPKTQLSERVHETWHAADDLGPNGAQTGRPYCNVVTEVHSRFQKVLGRMGVSTAPPPAPTPTSGMDVGEVNRDFFPQESLDYLRERLDALKKERDGEAHANDKEQDTRSKGRGGRDVNRRSGDDHANALASGEPTVYGRRSDRSSKVGPTLAVPTISLQTGLRASDGSTDSGYHSQSGGQSSRLNPAAPEFTMSSNNTPTSARPASANPVQGGSSTGNTRITPTLAAPYPYFVSVRSDGTVVPVLIPPTTLAAQQMAYLVNMQARQSTNSSDRPNAPGYPSVVPLVSTGSTAIPPTTIPLAPAVAPVPVVPGVSPTNATGPLASQITQPTMTAQMMRPFFPVTTKPRDHDPVKQQLYEMWLEWRKENEPGYHLGCKMRQAQRVLRQHQQEQARKAQQKAQQEWKEMANKAKAAAAATAKAAKEEAERRAKEEAERRAKEEAEKVLKQVGVVASVHAGWIAPGQQPHNVQHQGDMNRGQQSRRVPAAEEDENLEDRKLPPEEPPSVESNNSKGQIKEIPAPEPVDGKVEGPKKQTQVVVSGTYDDVGKALDEHKNLVEQALGKHRDETRKALQSHEEKVERALGEQKDTIVKVLDEQKETKKAIEHLEKVVLSVVATDRVKTTEVAGEQKVEGAPKSDGGAKSDSGNKRVGDQRPFRRKKGGGFQSFRRRDQHREREVRKD